MQINFKEFYLNNPDFDYYSYRDLYKDKFTNYTELDVIKNWIESGKPKILKNKESKKKDVIVHYSCQYIETSGGGSALYKICSFLEKKGIRVRYSSLVKIPNHVFNNFYDDDFDLNDSVVIYPEILSGNPLNAPNVVRWLLADIGVHTSDKIYESWNFNDLVYYFNYKIDFEKEDNKFGNIYKLFSFITINPKFKNYKKEKNGYCHTFRKSNIHKNVITNIHPSTSFEINQESHNLLILIFNKYKYFVSYDPLTFLNILAALCGCISIIYPVEGMTKIDWIKTTVFYPYLKQIDSDNINLYGVAYGNSAEELKWAEDTIHLVEKQISDIIKMQNNNIDQFIKDINNWSSNMNTVENIYYKN